MQPYKSLSNNHTKIKCKQSEKKKRCAHFPTLTSLLWGNRFEISRPVVFFLSFTITNLFSGHKEMPGPSTPRFYSKKRVLLKFSFVAATSAVIASVILPNL